MIPQVLYGLIRGAQALLGSGGSGASSGGSLDCDVFAVVPGCMQKFLADVPDGISADALIEHLFRRGADGLARKAAAEANAMLRQYPGRIMFGNF